MFEKKGSCTNQTGAVGAGVFSVHEGSEFGAEKLPQKNPLIWLLQK